MESLADLLKNGIESRDWQLIERAYISMFGPLDLKSPSKKGRRTKTPKPKPLKPKSKPEPWNKFHDDLSEHLELIQEKPQNKEGKVVQITPRDRPPPTYKEVTCRRCNKKETVHPMLAPTKIGGEDSLYLCNSCGVGGK